MQTILQAFSAGQQARLHEVQLAEIRHKQEVEAQLPAARAAYFQGDPSQLQKLDPNAYRSLELLRTQAENQASEVATRQAELPGKAAKAQEEVAAATLAKHLEQATAWGNILRASNGDPRKLASIKQAMLDRGVDAAGGIPDLQTPEQIAEARKQNDVALSIYTKPKTTDAMIEVAGASGVPLDQVLSDPRARPFWQKHLEGKGGITINNSPGGGQAPTQTTLNTLQATQDTAKDLEEKALEYQRITNELGGFAKKQGVVDWGKDKIDALLNRLDPNSEEYARLVRLNGDREWARQNLEEALRGHILAKNGGRNPEAIDKRLEPLMPGQLDAPATAQGRLDSILREARRSGANAAQRSQTGYGPTAQQGAAPGPPAAAPAAHQAAPSPAAAPTTITPGQARAELERRRAAGGAP